MQQDVQRAGAAQQPGFSYDCFISYRRSDGTKIARWLRRHLLSYRLPRAFREGRSRALSVYLDTAYERATDDYYDDNIAPAVRESHFLMVVGTPSANETIDGGKPNWIEREIADFSATPQGKTNFLAIRAAGRWEDPFPGKLLQRFPYLHIVDLRDVSNAPFRRLFDWIVTPAEITALAAPLYGITQKEMPELRQEEAKRIRARLVAAASSAVAVLTVIMSLVAYGLHQKASADTARQTIHAEYLAWQSGVAAESPGQLSQALLLAIEGFRRAPTLLTASALHDRADSIAIPAGRFKHEGPARIVRFSADGKLLVSGGDDGRLSLVDVDTLAEVAHLDQDRPVRDIRFGPGPDEITAIVRKISQPRSHDAPDPGRLISWRWKESGAPAQYDAPLPVYNVAFDAGRVVGIVDGGIWHPPQQQAKALEGYAPNDRTQTRLSPDMKYLAVARTRDVKSIDVFEVATAARVHSIPVDWQSGVSALGFDREGRRLIVGTSDGRATIFDLQSKARPVNHDGHSDPIAFAVSADNKFVAEIDGPDGANLAIWHIENGNNVFSGPAQGVNTEHLRNFRVAFSEDSRLVAMCLGDRVVRIMYFDGDDASEVLRLTTSAVVSDVALHPSRALVATADLDGGVTLWRLERGRGVAEFSGSSDFAMNETDGRVALLGGPLQIVDASFHAVQFDLDTKDVRASRFSRSGKLLALGRADGTIAVVDFPANRISSWFDPGAGKPAAQPAKNDDDDDADQRRGVHVIGFSADETQLILVRESGVSTIDLVTGVETVRIKERMSASYVISRDGSLLAGRFTGLPISIYDLKTFTKLPDIATVAFDPAVAFSPDGKYIAGRFKEKGTPERSRDSFVVWDLATRQPLLSSSTPLNVSDIAFSPDSQYFAFVDDKKFQIWNIRSKTRVDNNQTTTEVGSIAFHPSEPYLAAEYRDRKIRVWKFLPAPEIVAEIPQDQELDSGQAGPLQFTPDGRYLLHYDGEDFTAFGKVATFSPWKVDDVVRVACQHALNKGLGPALWDDYLRGEPYRETCVLPNKAVKN